jgi:putative PIN family toxin of toxin-antitoxin system
MIAVLDTNVVISALLSSTGAPAAIMEHWKATSLDVATSPALLKELERALGYDRVRARLRYSESELRVFLRDYRASAINARPDFTLEVVEADPSDNRVLECAVAAEAAYIVTGDSHLLDLERYQGVAILDPAAFLVLLALEEADEM